MLKPNEIKKALNSFAKKVVIDAKNNLDNKGNLANSIKYKKIEVGKNWIMLSFQMLTYGLYVDKGVKGKDPSQISPNAKIKGQQAANSPYKFGSGSSRGTFKKFSLKMADFAKKRSIRFRQGKTGKFAKGGFKSMGYVIAKNIYFRGLKPSLFFTSAFNKHFEDIPEALKTAYASDAENYMRTTLKDINK